MRDTLGAAAFEDMAKSGQVGIEISIGMGNAVSHAGLGGEMDDAVKTLGSEQLCHSRAVGQIELYKTKIRHPFKPL